MLTPIHRIDENVGPGTIKTIGKSLPGEQPNGWA